MVEKEINKKGQVTILAIVAIAIVAVIIIFFIYKSKIAGPNIKNIEENPSLFIEECVQKNVNDAIDILLPQGGFISSGHSKIYNDINVSYLCYNAGNYIPCVNEHSLFLTEIKNEIKNYAAPRIDKCFQDYKREVEDRQGIINLGEMAFIVELVPDRVFVNIKRDVNVNFKEQSYNYNNFDFEIISPIYNLARIAMEIASQEAKYCYFEYIGYTILYPRYKIQRFTMSDNTEIYSIKDKRSEKEMNIAIRSCAIPPGL
ncbi:MAG: hypothetical protein AABX83_01220 [Nanoarchaeota archaeon]|mgnify:CR=1 FL=1